MVHEAEFTALKAAANVKLVAKMENLENYDEDADDDLNVNARNSVHGHGLVDGKFGFGNARKSVHCVKTARRAARQRLREMGMMRHEQDQVLQHYERYEK